LLSISISLADSTGIPSPSNTLPPLECSLSIHICGFHKLSIWWWENSGCHCGASYHASGSSSRDSPCCVAFDAACSVLRHHWQRLK